VPEAGSPATGGTPAGTGGAPSTGGSVATAGNVATGGTTGPSGSPTLASLSPEELLDLCSSAHAEFEASGAWAKAEDAACRFGGAFTAALLGEGASDAELQQLCQDIYDECIAEPAEPDCGNSLTTCEATVEEFQACVDEYPEYIDALDAAFPECSELTAASLETLVEAEPELPPACALLDEKCPDQEAF
jgi:hypothetical protein